MAEAPSKKNKTPFEEFLENDEKTYTASLCDISEGGDINQRVDIISKEIASVLQKIQEHKKTSIDGFVIGKTFARQLKNKKKPFNHMDFDTWKLAGGLNGRWKTKYRHEGYDGLVAICAVRRHMLNRKQQNDEEEEEKEKDMPLFNHQMYTLALEQQLIHHFAYTEQDIRLENTSLSTGAIEGGSAIAYVIYIAFRLEQNEE